MRWRALASIAALAVAGLLTVASFGQEEVSVWDGVYTTEQAERGRELYAEGCGECHGVGLEGDDMSPPLVGSDFLWDWNGLSVGDLFERIRLSMPEDKVKSMTDQEKADVLAFMFAENQMPPGEAELAAKTGDLTHIAIEAVAP